MLYISIIIVILLLFSGFINPIYKYINPKPIKKDGAISFQESQYYHHYNDAFNNICRRAQMDYKKLNIWIIPNYVSDNYYINAAAVETIKDRYNMFFLESTFKYFELNHPEMIEVIFAHELGHLKYKDSLYKTLINEFLPFLVPFAVMIIFFVIQSFFFLILDQLHPILSGIVVLLAVIITIPLLLILALTMITGEWLPIWHNQLTEIRADIFAAKICGTDKVNSLLNIIEQNEIEYFSSFPFWERLSIIYKTDREHPDTGFRSIQVEMIDKVTFTYRMKHYFRIIFWVLTLRGFSGRNIFLSRLASSS